MELETHEEIATLVDDYQEPISEEQSIVEIVKCGFRRKLPLLPLLWHANAVDET